MSINLNDLYEIFFTVILSTDQKNTAMTVKAKYQSNKQLNNFIYTVVYSPVYLLL
jgi:hypothetical protein